VPAERIVPDNQKEPRRRPGPSPTRILGRSLIYPIRKRSARGLLDKSAATCRRSQASVFRIFKLLSLLMGSWTRPLASGACADVIGVFPPAILDSSVSLRASDRCRFAAGAPERRPQGGGPAWAGMDHRPPCWTGPTPISLNNSVQKICMS
jgi:hypothetical protein